MTGEMLGLARPGVSNPTAGTGSGQLSPTQAATAKADRHKPGCRRQQARSSSGCTSEDMHPLLRALLWLPAVCGTRHRVALGGLAHTPRSAIPPARSGVPSASGPRSHGSPCSCKTPSPTGTGIADQLGSLSSTQSILFVFLFAAPLEEGLKVAAAWPAFRSSHFDEAFDGMLYATASATGFATVEAALHLGSTRVTGHELARTGIVLVAQPLLSTFWGYSLGKVRRTKAPTFQFTLLWLAATVSARAPRAPRSLEHADRARRRCASARQHGRGGLVDCARSPVVVWQDQFVLRPDAHRWLHSAAFAACHALCAPWLAAARALSLDSPSAPSPPPASC